MLIGTRNLLTGWWLIYQGGRHQVWCDGYNLHRTFDDGRVELAIGRCVTWEGGCPAHPPGETSAASRSSG